MAPRPSPRENNARTVFGTDLVDRSLGVGTPNGADKAAGKARARYAKVDLTGGGAVAGTVREYDVGHDLGEIPTSVELESYENAAVAGTFISANAVRRENWSHSHCHVSIRLAAGSLDGCQATFLVKGR
jgi:hypothetical protein